jgi:hypothetical protein
MTEQHPPDRLFRRRLIRPDGTVIWENIFSSAYFEIPKDLPRVREYDGDTGECFANGERILGKVTEEIDFVG